MDHSSAAVSSSDSIGCGGLQWSERAFLALSARTVRADPITPTANNLSSSAPEKGASAVRFRPWPSCLLGGMIACLWNQLQAALVEIFGRAAGI
jgi:hypothetical protein